MRFIGTILLLFFSLAISAEPVKLKINDYAFTKVALKMDSDNFAAYRNLAAKIGFDYDRVYSYREFVDTKRANEVGSAGNYDYLLLSTGGNSWNAEDDSRARKSPLHWEMEYYKNHDMTVIWLLKNEGGNTLVKLLKLAHGRVANLHQQ